MKQVEDEAMMGLKGMAGMDTSREAMHEVLGHERDLILARSHFCISSFVCCHRGSHHTEDPNLVNGLILA